MNVTSLKFFSNTIRSFATKPVTNGDIQPFIYNRNPRNLERLRLERKPTGYFLENKNVEFWHKVLLNSASKYVNAKLIHNTGKVVVQASTSEWAIQKHLYSTKDRQAHITLAKVFAERCMESGFISVACDIEITEEDTNVQIFLKNLQTQGLLLYELPLFNIHDVWYKDREKRPWTVLED